MTIERLHFEKGYPVDTKQDILDELSKIAALFAGQFQTLSEGEYNLTPKWWTNNLYKHNLVVLTNGRGIYRGIPRDNNVGRRMFDENGLGGFVPGGVNICLPEDQQIAIVSGPLKDRKTYGIYEFIIYTPGPNPY